MSFLTQEQKSAIDPCQSIWVGASAGSGKTFVLTNRVLRLLLHGAKPYRILCLTFTKIAAAQMANRIHTTLARWAVSAHEDLVAVLRDLLDREPTLEDTILARGLFAGVLDCPGGLKVLTIHSFCQTILTRFPVECDISPGASVVDERRQAELFDDVGHIFMRRVNDGSMPDHIVRAFHELADVLGESQLLSVMQIIMAERTRFSKGMDAVGGRDHAIAHVADKLSLSMDATRETILQAHISDLGNTKVRGAVEALKASGSISDQKRAQSIEPFLESKEDRVALFEEYTTAFLTSTSPVKIRSQLATKRAKADFPDIVEVLTDEAHKVIEIQKKYAALKVFRLSRALLLYGSVLIEAYTVLKKQSSLLDYSDLISVVHDLLTRTPAMAPWVLFKLDGGLDHLLVDEAQDTSREQWEIISALTDEFYRGLGQGAPNDRTLFVVGDVKQSIFSFQGANSEMFESMRVWFQQRYEDVQRPMSVVPLFQSFRSAPAVLSVVDAVFAEGRLSASGVRLPHAPVRHTAFQSQLRGQVDLWPLSDSVSESSAVAWVPPVQVRAYTDSGVKLADKIAKTIAGWLAAGTRAAGDIMILVRRRNAFFEAMIRALKNHNVPVSGQDRLRLGEQILVQDLLALSKFLLLTADDLSLAAVLKSPVVGWTEDQLFQVAYDRGKRTLWAAVADERADESWQKNASALLGDLLSKVDFFTPFELFSYLLNAHGGRAMFIARMGTQVEDVLNEFLSLALTYELENPPSMQGFIHWFMARDTEVKRDLEQTKNEVRVMTVHGAKGLEAPVVFLPDTTSVPKNRKPIVWQDDLPVWRGATSFCPDFIVEAKNHITDSEYAEYNRLLYVALTRAEQHLIVCGALNKKQNEVSDTCWYSSVKCALEGMPNTQSLSTPFGPGIAYCDDGEAQKARQHPYFAQESSGLPPWMRDLPPPEPTPSRPLFPSKLNDDDVVIRSPVVTDANQDPYLRGRLIHKLFEFLPEAPASSRRPVTEKFLLTPAFNLSSAQVEEITTTVFNILDDARFADIFSGQSRAEVPIVGMLGTHVLSGVIDRLVVTDRQVWIIDYKTNRPAPDTLEQVPREYLRQMAIYREALAKVYTQKILRCAFLWTDGPHIMIID